MSPQKEQVHPEPAVVVPRWECRVFGDLEAADGALEAVRSVDPVESDETYVLSLYGDASLKIRDGLLDIKVLTRVNGAGLQLWVPTMKASVPARRRRGRHLLRGARRPATERTAVGGPGSRSSSPDWSDRATTSASWRCTRAGTARCWTDAWSS